MQEPEVAKYILDWGTRTNDYALVATWEEKLVGAIWGRIFHAKDPGYGFVDAHTPEISMAVLGDFRGRGIGSQLLQKIEEPYKEKGVKALSLSMDKRNPAKLLYYRMGYRLYSETSTSQTLRKSI